MNRWTGMRGVAAALGLILITTAQAPAMGAGSASDQSVKHSAIPRVFERPDRLSARSTAIAQGHRVEDLSQRTPTSSTYANPNGSWTTEAAAGVSRAPSGSGWAPVDSSLVRVRRGFAPRNAPFNVTFGRGGSSSIAQSTLANGVSMGIGWVKVLPAPRVDSASLTYPRAAGLGDLLVTSSPTGFDYSVLLHARPTAPLTIPIPLSVKGARFRPAPDGSILVLRGKTIVARMSAPVMWDSAKNARRVPVAVSVAKSRQGVLLTLRPSAAWLSSTARVFPVTVDPTVTINGSGDTWVDSLSNTSSQSTSTELHVGTQTLGVSVARSYLNFDTSALTANPGVVVSAATLNLTGFDSGSCPASAVKLSQVTSAWSPTSLTWSTQPTVTATGSSTSTQAFGGSGCPAAPGTVSLAATSIVQSWISGAANDGVQLAAVNESDNAGWRRFYSSRNGTPAYVPVLSVTYMTTPTVPASGSITPGTSNGSTVYTNNTKPTFATTISTPDGGTVTGEVKITQGSTTIADWTSAAVVSGSQVSYAPTTALADGTYAVQWRASNGTLTSAWSSAQAFVVKTVPPAAPAISCTNYSNGVWYTTAPASSTTCSVTLSSDTQWLWVWNGVTWLSFPPASGGVTSKTFTIAANDSFYLYAAAVDLPGNQAITTYSFGTGDGGFASPTVGQMFTSSLPINASAPSGATSAIINWRPAGTTTWTQATQLTSGASAWTGSVSSFGNISRTGNLSWNASAETGISAPESLEIQACFTYSTGQKCGSPRLVSLVAHAFGGTFPTTSVGPASVSLLTGEYQLGQTDVSVRGYKDTLSLSRTFQSLGAPVTPANSVFGPGWVANLDGPTQGAAAMQVLDQTGSTGTIQLIDTDGSASVYKLGGPAAEAPGNYVGQGTTATDNTKLVLTAGTGGGPATLTLTDADGVVTTWTNVTGSTVWNVSSISDPTTSSILYTYTGNYLTGMYSAPPGITCNATTQNRGCRALKFVYTGTGSSTRLTEVDLVTWDPKPDSNGLPTAAAGMTTTPVERYSYNTYNQLNGAWDPRLDHDSGQHVQTVYTYQAVGGQTLLATVTPPAQTAWNFNVDSSTGALQSVTRPQDQAIGGTATWRIVYNLSTSPSSSLPDMTASSVKTWGQTTVPDQAAAVFGPNAPVGSTDYTYASLYYFTKAGVSTNNAVYGAGTWNISSQEFDGNGNPVWSLTAADRAAGFAQNWTPAQIRSYLGTTTVYSADGTRVENTTAPISWIYTQNGTAMWGAKQTVNIYDDEAATADMPGQPANWASTNSPRHNLLIKQISQVVDAGGQTYDPHTTWYRYDPVVAGDGSGWTLGVPTRTSTSFGSGWSTAMTRYDSQGRMVETRTPQGVSTHDGAGSDARSTVTTYYTADASSPNPACRNHPEWVDAVCTLGPAGSSSAPIALTRGFDYLGNPTVTADVAGSSEHDTVTAYDSAGRPTSLTFSSINAPSGEQPVATTTDTYNAWSGSLQTVTAGSATMWTTYDQWGRVLTQSDGAGNTGTSTYNAAGQLATFNDGKATYTYTYDGSDANGKTEHRGLTTRIDTGLAGGTGVITAAYSPDSQESKLVYPNGMSRSVAYDTSDQPANLTYYQPNGTSVAGWSVYRDVYGRIRTESGPMAQDWYGYDDLGRLVNVQDTVQGVCTTRAYSYTLDSDRSSLTSYAPAANNSCSTTTTATTTTGTFNNDDQKIDTGYTYDVYGRTTNLPAADTGTPSSGDIQPTYYADGMVASLAQPGAVGGAKSVTYALDAAQRIGVTTASTSGTALRISTNHYSDGSDSPAWVDNQTRASGTANYTDAWSRNILGPSSDLVMTQSSDGTSQIEITNLHGDVVATLPNATYNGFPNYNEATEFGAARTNTAALTQYYTWLGSQRRSGDALAGLVLMGQRLYNPQTGRFLSRDPVLGGNDNPYTYPPDPVNQSDASGACSCGQNTGWAIYRSVNDDIGDWGTLNGGISSMSIAEWLADHLMAHLMTLGFKIKGVGFTIAGLTPLADQAKYAILRVYATRCWKGRLLHGWNYRYEVKYRSGYKVTFLQIWPFPPVHSEVVWQETAWKWDNSYGANGFDRSSRWHYF